MVPIGQTALTARQPTLPTVQTALSATQPALTLNQTALRVQRSETQESRPNPGHQA